MVLTDYLSRWEIEYQLLDGTYKTRRINKACVSSQPMEYYLKKVKVKKYKSKGRVEIERLKIKSRGIN